MSKDDDSAEKSHEPSQKKLDDARKKGEFPKSVDMTTAAAYAGLLLAMMIIGGSSMSAMGTAMSNILARADTFSVTWFQDSGTPISLNLIGAISKPLLGWFGLPALAALFAIIAQQAFVVAPDKL